MIRNMIGGEVREISREDFLKLFDKEVHSKLIANIDRADVGGIVCFENQTLDSSALGDRTALIYGVGCRYKTLEELCKGRLGEVPSRFQYPVAVYIKEKK